MKWSPILHGIAAVAGIAGTLALLAAWIAGWRGTLFGLTEQHFFNDAMGLLLVSIVFGVGTLVHLKEEKR